MFPNISPNPLRAVQPAGQPPLCTAHQPGTRRGQLAREVDCLREPGEVPELDRRGAVLPAAAPPRGRAALRPLEGGGPVAVLFSRGGRELPRVTVNSSMCTLRR